MNSNSSDNQTTHQTYEWRGSPFQIGFQHGQVLRREIIKEYTPALSAAAAQSGLSQEATAARFRERFAPVFQEHVPRAMEEIEGIAEGSGLPIEQAFFAAVWDGATLKPAAPAACTAFVCSQGTTLANKVLVGQTKDTCAPLERYRIMRVAYDDGLRAVILNYPGWIGNICMTSQGLSFCGNSLCGAVPSTATVPHALLKRLVLEKSSVSEVLAVIESLEFENGCFLIADAGGHAVCLEIMAGQMVIKDISGQAFGHANNALSPQLEQFETRGYASSRFRQHHIQRILDASNGTITVESMKTALGDHTDLPLSICRHESPLDSTVTTAAFIADLSELKMYIAIGQPCSSPFVCYDLPAA